QRTRLARYWPKEPLRADHSQNLGWHRDILFPAEVSIRPILTSYRKVSPRTSICLDRERYMEKASWRRMHNDRFNARPLRHYRPMGLARRALRNHVGQSGESLRLVDCNARCLLPNGSAQAIFGRHLCRLDLRGAA